MEPTLTLIFFSLSLSPPPHPPSLSPAPDSFAAAQAELAAVCSALQWEASGGAAGASGTSPSSSRVCRRRPADQLLALAARTPLPGLPAFVADTPTALSLVEVVCLVIAPQQAGSPLSPAKVVEHAQRQGLGVVGARLLRLSQETAAAYVRIGQRSPEVVGRLRADGQRRGRHDLVPVEPGRRHAAPAVGVPPCLVLALQHTNAVTCAAKLLCGGRDPGLAAAWNTDVFASASMPQAEAELALLLRYLSLDCAWELEN